MRKLLLFLPLLLFSGFTEPAPLELESYRPLLMTRSQLVASVGLTHAEMPLNDPGKICLYKNWIFLVEKYKGIHLIDNNDPSNPIRKDFLKVPGCMDVAIRNHVLYVDNAVDLVAVGLDLDDLTAKELSRRTYALPELCSPLGYIPGKFTRKNRLQGTEIVGWVPIEYTN